MTRKLRMGMVGGGQGAAIGRVHRMAAALDGRIELVSGAFSANRQRSKDSGEELGLNPDRVYGTYREMFRREAKTPEDQRLDFVTVVTPNNMHYPIAMAALDAGYHVLTDVPMTLSLDEAENMAKKIKATDRIFCLTHNLIAYPMIREARDVVRSGELGNIRRVVVECPRGWLASRLETSGDKQAIWRTDPKRAGLSCCLADLGPHGENLAVYVTGLRITEVCADLNTFVKGRPLDDDASVLLRFDGGARGVLWTSHIAIGSDKALRLRVYGEQGSIDWSNETPGLLTIHRLNAPSEMRQTVAYRGEREDMKTVRQPAERPNGYADTFADIYSRFANAIYKRLAGETLAAEDLDFPSVEDGIRDMKFVDAVVRSSKAVEKWVPIDPQDAPAPAPTTQT